MSITEESEGCALRTSRGRPFQAEGLVAEKGLLVFGVLVNRHVHEGMLRVLRETSKHSTAWKQQEGSRR